MRRKMPGLPHTGSPRILTVPLLGLSWPVMSLSSVDLPAPFGPSSPVTPLPIVMVMSLSPITCPYHFDRFSAATTGGTWLVIDRSEVPSQNSLDTEAQRRRGIPTRRHGRRVELAPQAFRETTRTKIQDGLDTGPSCIFRLCCFAKPAASRPANPTRRHGVHLRPPRRRILLRVTPCLCASVLRQEISSLVCSCHDLDRANATAQHED